jgi:hypothetical protein
MLLTNSLFSLQSIQFFKKIQDLSVLQELVYEESNKHLENLIEFIKEKVVKISGKILSSTPFFGN